MSVFAYLWHHLFTWWGFLVLAGGSLLELGYLYIVVLRAYDVEYDQNECDESWPRIDLKKALRRRVSIPRLGLPLWLFYAAALAVWFVHMTLHTYIAIAFVWFMTTPLRKMLGIAIARKAHRDSQNQEPETSYWDDVVYYYTWALDLPEAPGGKVWFRRKLKWLNKFRPVLFFWWYLLQVWRLWGMLFVAIASLVWPVAALCSIFYHVDSVDEYRYHKPWWRINRKGKAPERKTRTVDGEVVKNEPADGKPGTIAVAAQND